MFWHICSDSFSEKIRPGCKLNTFFSFFLSWFFFSNGILSMLHRLWKQFEFRDFIKLQSRVDMISYIIYIYHLLLELSLALFSKTFCQVDGSLSKNIFVIQFTLWITKCHLPALDLRENEELLKFRSKLKLLGWLRARLKCSSTTVEVSPEK